MRQIRLQTLLTITLGYVGLAVSLGLSPQLSHNVSTSTFHESPELELIDEENDGKILVDVIASIAEWKDRQQRKLLHYLFHRQKRDEEVVCYGELGCFRDEGPFNYLDMLPSPPEEIGTVFYLYTRKNNEQAQMLDYLNVTSITTSHFNVSNPTKIIIHGFGSSCTKIWPREMRLSFLQVEDVNVICVDWAAGAVDPNYVRAAVNTRLVGKQVAAMINGLSSESGLSINNNTHLVGFSLGAHVSGFVGKELRNLSRITGLDPAGPLFEGYSANVRLDKTDADYVDVIHSNGDSLIIGGLGAWEPIGHVDFYPNGGKAQRGCQNLLIGGLYDFVYSYTAKNESQTYRYLCNHRRAYKLFTDSISPKCQFTAFPCESYEKFESGECFSCSSEAGDCGQLGYRSNMSPGRGSLYLLTREEEPFCAAQFKIKLMFTGSRQPIYTYGAIQIKLISKEGVNETFTLTSNHDELLTSGAKIEKLIVSHPALSEPTDIQILYIAYEGWIYSGREVWSVEKLILSDGYGTARSWCKEHGELLPGGVPVRVPLQLGECSGSSVPPLEKLPPQLPPGPGLPLKIGNIRPPLLNNEITGHTGDLLELTAPSPDQTLHHSEARPLLVNLKPGSPEQLAVPGNTKIKHRPPLQPFHLQGPPGAWNIVTSKPGSLPPPIHVYQSKLAPAVSSNPNTEGIEVQFGPRLPLPPINPKPLHHFPPRRRPATKSEMSTAESESSVTLAVSDNEQRLAVTERVVVIETNDINPNMTGDNEKPANQSIKTDILSSDQVTIFKVGPDNDIVRVSNDTQDNGTQTDTDTDYKFVILHKLPNGNALNLENLKTYNYEDLIMGHSSVIEDSNREEMLDRENLEFFDVPRRVSGDKPEPYIIYQLPDKPSDQQTGGGGGGVGPVYRRPVRPVYKATAEVEELTHTKDDPVINRPKVGLPPVAATNDWIPTNRKKSGEISLDKLTELSQLAQVSITNKGPIRVASAASSAPLPPKLNVQLLPSRLSAVLSHLDSTSREREERLGRAGPGLPSQSSQSAGHRQNKISPAFQPSLKNIRDRMYGRKIHTGYVVTQPYQTQVIPSQRHKYIPLASHHHLKPLWWQPPVRPHQLMRSPQQHFSVGSLPLTVPVSAPLTNQSQSEVLPSNQSDPVSGPVPLTGPVYIIELNQTSEKQNNNRSLTMNSPAMEQLVVTDFPLVHFNETAEKNNTEEMTTEQSSNQKLEDFNLTNESSQNLQLQSEGNLKLPDIIRSKSVNKWIDESRGKQLQELSPNSNNTKLRSPPASGMVNHSQE